MRNGRVARAPPLRSSIRTGAMSSGQAAATRLQDEPNIDEGRQDSMLTVDKACVAYRNEDYKRAAKIVQGLQHPYTVKCKARHTPCQPQVGHGVATGPAEQLPVPGDRFQVTSDKCLVTSCSVPSKISCHSKDIIYMAQQERKDQR